MVIIAQVPHRDITTDGFGRLELVSKHCCSSGMIRVSSGRAAGPRSGLSSHNVARMSHRDPIETCLPGGHLTDEPGVRRIVIEQYGAKSHGPGGFNPAGQSRGRPGVRPPWLPGLLTQFNRSGFRGCMVPTIRALKPAGKLYGDLNLAGNSPTGH